MDDIAFLEELQYNAFPPLSTLLYDGWTLRFGGNFTYRVNCANPVYPGALPLKEKLDYVEEAYRASGLNACIVKVHDGMGEQTAACDRLLDVRGYGTERRGNIYICDLPAFAHSYNSDVQVASAVEDVWLGEFLDMNGTRDPSVREAAVQMLKSITMPILAASIRQDGKTVACGLGVCERGFVGLYDIYVDEQYRRQRLGADLCAAIMERGRDQGCHTAYLQVLADNFGAREMYRCLGYRQDYEYWFRILRF